MERDLAKELQQEFTQCGKELDRLRQQIGGAIIDSIIQVVRRQEKVANALKALHDVVPPAEVTTASPVATRINVCALPDEEGEETTASLLFGKSDSPKPRRPIGFVKRRVREVIKNHPHGISVPEIRHYHFTMYDDWLPESSVRKALDELEVQGEIRHEDHQWFPAGDNTLALLG